MHDYTNFTRKKQYENLAARVAAKKKEREDFERFREESDKSVSMLSGSLIFLIFIAIVAAMAIFFLMVVRVANADEYSPQEYCAAIYIAEGGTKAKKPYGILSVECNTREECRQICENTVRNNFKRYADYGYKTHATYLEFLASRYAPLNSTNDPTNLNRHWIKNVRFYLGGA